MIKRTVSYAQNREDIYINWLLRGKVRGFYVDIGASEPVHHSVTKYFYDRGWRGINIDPIRRNIDLLNQDRPRDINIQKGIGKDKGIVVFREYPEAGGLSTFSKDMQSEYTYKYIEYGVEIDTLKDTLNRYLKNGQRIDFIKIDVEGLEHDVICSNDWKIYGSDLIIIESNHVFRDWHHTLKSAGYKEVFYDGLNEYFMKEPLQLKKLRDSYPEYVIGPMPIYYEQYNEILDIENHSHHLELIVRELKAENNDLFAQQKANKRIRVLVKKLVVGTNAAILARIENLNKHRVKQQKTILFTDNSRKADLLVRIKQYDQERYYRSRTTGPILYRIVLSVYRSLYNFLKSFARSLFRGLRGLKNV
ncbi:MAG: FkbM family methyltransferase [Patescibacteria group bacterium]